MQFLGPVRAILMLSFAVTSPLLGHAQTPVKAADLSRIVSIGGDVTEILYALGLESNIVAVDTTSVYPPSALAAKKSVGYMRALSTEGVLSLAPSVIIAAEDAGPPEVVSALKQSPVPVVTIGGADTPAGTEDRIRAVAAAVGVPQKGEVLAANIRRRYDELARKRETSGIRPKVLFLLSLQSGRATAGGRGTSADEVISLAGGQNVVTAFDGYKQLSDEAAIELAPEIILVMKRSQQPGGSTSEPVEKLIATMPGLSATPAARNGRIVEVDGAALLQFGPRTADAAAELLSVFTAGKKSARSDR
jgi:iron complex transport system substrate-binding protein